MLQALKYIEGNNQTGRPNHPKKPWHPIKNAKPDCFIQFNCREVCTYASYKTTRTRTWENFDK